MQTINWQPLHCVQYRVQYMHIVYTKLQCLYTRNAIHTQILRIFSLKFFHHRLHKGVSSSLIHSPWPEDKVDSGIGLSYQPASICSPAGWYANPVLELNLSPQSGTATDRTWHSSNVLKINFSSHSYRTRQINWQLHFYSCIRPRDRSDLRFFQCVLGFQDKISKYHWPDSETFCTVKGFFKQDRILYHKKIKLVPVNVKTA